MAPEIATTLQAMAYLLDVPEQFARMSLQIVSAVISSEEDQRAVPRSAVRREQPEQPDSRMAHVKRPNNDESESSDLRHTEPTGQGPETEHREMREAVRRQSSHDDLRYEVYTTQFDRTSIASDLRDDATLKRRRRDLDQHAGAVLAGIMRWAHRLQRRLLAVQLRSWQFDRDEGLLDAARLARIVTHPLEPLAYKEESEIEFPDTVVSLLVDNSGSMRGAPITTAAGCVEILGRVLERCGVKTEILGFTTCSWHGGQARRKWVADGCPSHPGRIADLQHVIYKSADEPWRRARPTLGLMLEDDLLKENIDGEALLWAVDRLQRRIEPRRILIVISDGAPLDEATLAANGAEFLDRHLRKVIERIEHFSQLDLLAIAIGHDVTAYYRRAVKLGSVEELGETLVGKLIELLASPRQKSRRPSQQTSKRTRAPREARSSTLEHREGE
jgi:cobaltochelatase CobT